MTKIKGKTRKFTNYFARVAIEDKKSFAGLGLYAFLTRKNQGRFHYEFRLPNHSFRCSDTDFRSHIIKKKRKEINQYPWLI